MSETGESATARGVPAHLLQWNRDNVVALAMKIRALRIQGLKVNKLILESRLVGLRGNRSDTWELAQQRFSRWLGSAEIGQKWRNLTEPEYRAIVISLYSNRKWSLGIEREIDYIFPDSLFYAMAHWIGMDETDTVEMRSRFTGSYKLYRHSLLRPRYVLVGRLDIVCDRDTKAVTTTERYLIERIGRFERKGYMFGKDRKYNILSRDIGNGDLQWMHIDSVNAPGGEGGEAPIAGMAGVLGDVQGHFYYATRFCCVRSNNIDITSIPFKKVPTSVVVEIGDLPVLDDFGYIVKF